MNRDMLSRRLTKRGYTVTMAVDGQEGVDAAIDQAWIESLGHLKNEHLTWNKFKTSMCCEPSSTSARGTTTRSASIAGIGYVTPNATQRPRRHLSDNN